MVQWECASSHLHVVEKARLSCARKCMHTTYARRLPVRTRALHPLSPGLLCRMYGLDGIVRRCYRPHLRTTADGHRFCDETRRRTTMHVRLAGSTTWHSVLPDMSSPSFNLPCNIYSNSCHPLALAPGGHPPHLGAHLYAASDWRGKWQCGGGC
jgi:hypothetical protein